MESNPIENARSEGIVYPGFMTTMKQLDRMYAARYAMQGMVSKYGYAIDTYSMGKIAENAVRMADLLLEELEKGKQND